MYEITPCCRLDEDEALLLKMELNFNVSSRCKRYVANFRMMLYCTLIGVLTIAKREE
ncbi:hypothetical protein [Porphyromonas macacae]|uniref:hypothetical protein n=1 Tax=Porphyromonas macacae TaxID=28115 RepID=UPI00135B3E6B|nr:hypothetical protein [Porphyromonas macacae]